MMRLAYKLNSRLQGMHHFRWQRPRDVLQVRDAGAFQKTWWLEAAAAAAFERVEVRWNGKLVASLPFVRTRKLGFTSIRRTA